MNTTYMKEKSKRVETNTTGLSPFSVYNFFSEKIEWEEVVLSVNGVNWEQITEGIEPDIILQVLLEKLLEVCEQHIPIKRHREENSSNIPRDRRIMMRNRATLNKQLVRARTEGRKRAITTKVIEIERKLKQSHTNQRMQEERKAIDKIIRNPKFFYSYCKRYSKVKTQIGPLKDKEGNFIKDPKQIADILVQQYNSVFSDPRTPKVVHRPKEFFEDELAQAGITDIFFTPESIERAIKELKPNAAAGPDGIPAILLLKCSKALALPISKLWRRSLDVGMIPALLKKLLVCPIYKGGDRSLAKNYRPVALTSHLIKIFEKCVRNEIVAYMEDHNLFSDNQHGFRKGRSCLSKLLAHYDWVLHNLAEGKNVDVVFLDFAKAFDKVDHGILLHKIKTLGITGKLGIWIHAFLTGRLQSVSVDGHRSEETKVISGVPQGSVLGPLLFLIYIGDIGEGIQDSSLSSFADDTSVSLPVTRAEEVSCLQKDLDTVYAWAATNNMQFNEEKFEMLRHGRKNDLKTEITLQTGGGQEVSALSHAKCLGVYLSEDCCFHHHISETTKRARSMAGWILRTFSSREPRTMLTLWKTLVQPILDYCSQLWSPHKKSEIQQLEVVQRSYTRQIQGMKDLGYWRRLKELGLYSQQRRRERYRTIYLWKVLEGEVPNPAPHALQPYITERGGRRATRKCLPTRAPEKIRTLLSNSLTYDGPKSFNALPKEVRNITGCSVGKFKSGLDKFLSTIPDEPPVQGYTARCRTSNSIPDQVALKDRDIRFGSSSGSPRL